MKLTYSYVVVRLFSSKHNILFNTKVEEKTPKNEAKEEEDIVIDESETSEQERLRQEGMILETEQIDRTTKETQTFKTETKQLLDIVATALYTDKEVFIRELISNASDALEKLRHLKLTNKPIEDPDKPLEINISVDEKLKTFTIQDSGIGMSKEDLIENIGTIAHSGSKAFAKALEKGGDTAANIIGQFGVGFYSVFMVADSVRVYSRSSTPGSKGYCWESSGSSGEYTVSEATGVARGTKIVLQLKESEKEFSMKETVESE